MVLNEPKAADVGPGSPAKCARVRAGLFTHSPAHHFSHTGLTKRQSCLPAHPFPLATWPELRVRPILAAVAAHLHGGNISGARPSEAANHAAADCQRPPFCGIGDD